MDERLSEDGSLRAYHEGLGGVPRSLHWEISVPSVSILEAGAYISGVHHLSGVSNVRVHRTLVLVPK